MDNSTRPKLTVEEIPPMDIERGVMQPPPESPSVNSNTQNVVQQTYVKPEEEKQVFAPNEAPVAYAGEPLNPNMQTTSTPEMFGEPMPQVKPLGNQPVVMKKSSFSLSALKFIIPALLIIMVIVAGAIFIPQYLASLNKEDVVIPEPTLVPATPLPTPDISPRTRNYLNVDKKITFDYLSSFTLVECSDKVIFAAVKPENIEGFCESEKGVLEIIVSTREIEVPEGYEQFENIVRIDSEQKDNFLLITLFDNKYEQLYRKITETIQFIDPDLTKGWERYISSSGYNISYPKEWTLMAAEDRENSKVTEIRKSVTETNLHNLAIKMTPNVTNAGLSASEIISSLQGLSGWKERPSVEFRVLDGEIAQIIAGEYENVWKTNVVVWKGSSLVEMTWQDEAHQPERLIFEGLLSTFSFVR